MGGFFLTADRGTCRGTAKHTQENTYWFSAMNTTVNFYQIGTCLKRSVALKRATIFPPIHVKVPMHVVSGIAIIVVNFPESIPQAASETPEINPIGFNLASQVVCVAGQN